MVGDLNSIDDETCKIQVKTVARNKQEYVENFPVIHNDLLGKVKAGDRVEAWSQMIQRVNANGDVRTHASLYSIKKVAKTTPYQAMGKMIGRLATKSEYDRNDVTGQSAWGFATFAVSDERDGGLFRADFFNDLATALKGWPRHSVVKIVGFLRHKFPNDAVEPMLRIAAGNDATELISKPDPSIIDPFLSEEAAAAYTPVKD
jgi:hypothetical protein